MEKTTKIAILEGLENVMSPTITKLVRMGAKIGLSIARGASPTDNESHSLLFLSECDCDNITILLWELRRRGLWPISKAYQNGTVGTLLEKLKFFSTPRCHDVHPRCPDCGHRFDRWVEILADRARKAVDGLCLDCVKNELAREGEYVCR